MKTFDLPAGSRVKVIKATPHKEHHGPDLVQAISLRLEWWPTDSAALNMLADGLQDALLHVPPEIAAQAPLDGIPHAKKWRRCPSMKMPIQIPKLEFTGYELSIEHGIDEDSALWLYTCKLGKFEGEVMEGGGSVIRWSLNSSIKITPELVGALCALEGAEIAVKELTPPDEPESIDGSREGGGPGFTDPGATDLFAGGDTGDADADAGDVDLEEEGDEQQGDDEDMPPDGSGRVAWPFPKNADSSSQPPPQSVTIERSQPGTRTARGRDKTKAALAAGSPEAN
jgi:hypothetical protein